MGVLRLRSSVSMSVAVHAVFFLAWALLIGQQAAKIAHPPKLTWIEVDPLSPEAKRRLEEKTKNRVVETAPSRKTDEAAEDAFLGKQNQIVDRQTVAKSPSLDAKGGSGKKSTAQSRKDQTKTKDQAKSRELSRFGLPMLPQQRELAKPEPQRDTGPYADERMSEGSQARDYIKGLKEGETTALNTKEYLFYGYFQRIRERLDMAWTGILREQLSRIFRAGRQLASEKEHTTKLLVTMNKLGEIVRVQVLEESGTMDLDDAAVKAFNKAGPFPNPPTGMVDSTGRVEIRWDFVLKT